MQEKGFTPLEEYLKETSKAGAQLNTPGFQVQPHKKGDVIFSEGSTGFAAYILKRGRVEISVKVKGKKVVLARLEERSVFGEMALILKEHQRTATATALEDSEVVKIPKDVFDQYMRDSPTVISSCLLAISRRLQESTDKASRSPDPFMGVARILHLFWEHDVRDLSYDKTVHGIREALAKEKAEITMVITLMESLNLVQVKDKETGEKGIHLLGEGSFMEKAIQVHRVLEDYPDSGRS